jgi:hypothetical protein
MKGLDITKRYWLFIYSTYYPRGGMHDFKDSFNSIEEIEEYLKDEDFTPEYQKYHIFDTEVAITLLF